MSGAKTDERPGLNRVRELFRTGAASHLIVWKLDRLSRADNDDVEAVMMDRELRKLGVTTHITTFGRAFGDSAEDQLVLSMAKAFAAYERRQIADRTTLGRNAKAKRGAYVGGGVAPYGYDRQGEKKTVALVINHGQAAIVRNIFQWYVAGDGDGPLGVGEIVRRLDAANQPTPGERHGRARKRDTASWSPHTVYNILRNPSYKGAAPYRRFKLQGKNVVQRPDADRMYTNVPAIVSPELWQAAQAKLATGNANSFRNAKHEYLVGRRIICTCGYRWQGTSKQSRGKTFIYYKCNSRDPMLTAGPNCGAPAIRAHKIDTLVWEWVVGLLQNEDQLRVKLEQRDRDAGKDRAELEAAIADEIRALRTIEHKQDRLLDGFTDGIVLKAAYEKKNAALEQERTQCQQRIDKLTAHADALTTHAPAQTIIDAAREVREQTHDANFATKRYLIDMLNVTVEMDRDEHGAWATIACEISAVRLLVASQSLVAC